MKNFLIRTWLFKVTTAVEARCSPLQIQKTLAPHVSGIK